MSDAWLQEEEKLLDLITNNTFDAIPLEKIAVSFIYIDDQREIVHIQPSQIDLSIQSNKSILVWKDLQAHIQSASKWQDKQYVFEESALHHINITYDVIDIFKPKQTLQPIIANQNVKIEPTLPLFHDLSELFVIMRRVIVLKPILKIGKFSSGKTKKVRIDEKLREIINIPGRFTKKLRCKPN